MRKNNLIKSTCLLLLLTTIFNININNIYATDTNNKEITNDATNENTKEEIDLNNLFREDASVTSIEPLPNAQEEIGEIIYIPETIEEEKEIQETINQEQQATVENEVSKNNDIRLETFDGSNVTTQDNKTNSSNSTLTVSILIISVVLIGGVAYTIYNYKKNKNENI